MSNSGRNGYAHGGVTAKLNSLVDDAYRRIQNTVVGPQTLSIFHTMIMSSGQHMVCCGDISSFISSTETVQRNGELRVEIRYQYWFPADVVTIRRTYPYLNLDVERT